MCGIAGVISLSSKNSGNTDFGQALKILSCRGPDASGTMSFGRSELAHTRLSIIDLDKRSNQPMKDAHLGIVFNGEIYNFQSLREQLKKQGSKFITSSDTEVLLKSYQQWGLGFLEKIDGMWSFCLADPKKDSYILSVDPIGQKPLVYCEQNDRLYFASEIPALLALLPQVPDADWDSIANFSLYNFRHIPAPRTGFKGVFKLEPGHLLHVANGVVSKKKYFMKTPVIANKKFTQTQVRKVLEESVQKTFVSDVPTALLLSGGIDSSLIAALAPKNTVAYAVGFDKNDEELHRARLVAKHTGIELNEIIFTDQDPKKLFQGLLDSVTHMGEPFQLYQSVYSHLLLSRMRSDGIKVALTGNGADEMFFGYDGATRLWYLEWIYRMASPVRSLLPSGFGKISKSAYQLKISLYEDTMNNKKHVKSKYRKFAFFEQVKQYSQETGEVSLLQSFNWTGLRLESQHSITMVSDLAGARLGMELRCPFLNRKLLDMSLSMKSLQKLPLPFKSFTKYPLRKLAKEILPKEISEAKKMGFGYSVAWTDVFAANSDLIIELLEYAANLPVYSKGSIQAFIEDIRRSDWSREDVIVEVMLVAWWHKNTY